MDYEGIEFLVGSGWQNNDKDHPVNNGKPGYRLVFKSLRLFPQKELLLSWSNLRIKISSEETSIGGMKVANAFTSRNPDKLLLIDSVEVSQQGKETIVVSKPNMKWEFNAWEKNLPKACFVEILLYTTASKPQKILEEGRRRTAGLKTILELAAGQRLLGVPIAEEVGEIFEDWHWNRNIGSVSVGSESQLDLKKIDNETIYPLIIDALTQTQKLNEKEKLRLRLASQWYWKTDGETDTVNAFIGTWIAIESIEMPNTTNISPIKERLALLTNTSTNIWKKPIGYLFGIRSKLVHGNISEVSVEHYKFLRQILQVLLEARLFNKEVSSLRNELLINVEKIRF